MGILENLDSLRLIPETLRFLKFQGTKDREQRFSQVDIKPQVAQVSLLLGIPSWCQACTQRVQGQEVLEAEEHLVLV